jgi:hypothetical protein
VDYLQRSEIAFALAGQLNDVWDAMNPPTGPVIPFDSAWWTGRFKRGPKETLEPGFVVHVDAPWGGGKTTFAQYLTQILNPYRLPELPDWLKDLPLGDAEKWKQSHRRPWHVVQFNAWQHEHVSPPWWVFYETIRKAATDAAVNETNQRWDDPPLDEDEDGKNRPAEPRKDFGYEAHPWMSHLRRFEFWVSETFWRLVTPKVLTSLYVTAATAIALWFLVWSGGFFLSILPIRRRAAFPARIFRGLSPLFWWCCLVVGQPSAPFCRPLPSRLRPARPMPRRTTQWGRGTRCSGCAIISSG